MKVYVLVSVWLSVRLSLPSSLSQSIYLSHLSRFSLSLSSLPRFSQSLFRLFLSLSISLSLSLLSIYLSPNLYIYLYQTTSLPPSFSLLSSPKRYQRQTKLTIRLHQNSILQGTNQTKKETLNRTELFSINAPTVPSIGLEHRLFNTTPVSLIFDEAIDKIVSPNSRRPCL